MLLYSENYPQIIRELQELRFENEYLKTENKRLQEKIDNFNKALEGIRR